MFLLIAYEVITLHPSTYLLQKYNMFIWYRYFLQPRSNKNRPSKSCSTPPGTRLSSDNSLGSLRLKIQYTADHVFPSEAYEPLCALLLQSVDISVSLPPTTMHIYVCLCDAVFT